MAPNFSSEKKQNPNEYLKIPEWINEQYFEPIIEKELSDFRRIVDFSAVAATQPGENYTSVMVRVAVDVELTDGSIQEKSYILKTSLEAGNSGAALVEGMCLFPKEIKMYQIILPQFEQLYKEAGVDIQMGPKCVHIDNTPERIALVLEDLRCGNFINMDRLQGLDMAHIRAVLHKLAEFHAASALYYELNGAYDDMYKISFFCEANRPMFEALGQKQFDMYIKAMRLWNMEDIERRISKMVEPDRMFDEGIRMNDSDPKEFNVLNHGDCWCNNIMFAHNEQNEIEQTLFVDFQVGRYGTPAQDLWYMILTTAQTDIKVKEFDQFIYIYHERLVECLKMLKYQKPMPSLKDLQITMLKYSFWAILTATATMSVVLLPSDKDANMESLIKEGPEAEEFQLKTLTNPNYVKAMKQLFPFFEHKGVFDI